MENGVNEMDTCVTASFIKCGLHCLVIPEVQPNMLFFFFGNLASSYILGPQCKILLASSLFFCQFANTLKKKKKANGIV